MTTPIVQLSVGIISRECGGSRRNAISYGVASVGGALQAGNLSESKRFAVPVDFPARLSS